MKAFLLMVGSELLSGMMIDTNSSYIAEELNRYGIEISGKMVVGDRLEEIKDGVNVAKARGDFVIISGGIITKLAVLIVALISIKEFTNAFVPSGIKPTNAIIYVLTFLFLNTYINFDIKSKSKQKIYDNGGLR